MAENGVFQKCNMTQFLLFENEVGLPQRQPANSIQLGLNFFVISFSLDETVWALKALRFNLY